MMTTLSIDGKISLLGKDNSGRWQMKLLSRNLKPHLMPLQHNRSLVVYNEYGNRLWEYRARGKYDDIPGKYIYFSEKWHEKSFFLSSIFLRTFSLSLLPLLLSIPFVVVSLIHFCNWHNYNALPIGISFSTYAHAIVIVFQELWNFLVPVLFRICF